MQMFMQHIYTCTCERSIIEFDKRKITQDNFIDKLIIFHSEKFTGMKTGFLQKFRRRNFDFSSTLKSLIQRTQFHIIVIGSCNTIFQYESTALFYFWLNNLELIITHLYTIQLYVDLIHQRYQVHVNELKDEEGEIIVEICWYYKTECHTDYYF